MDTKVKLWEGCPDNGLHKQRTADMSRFINTNALNSLTKHLQRFQSLVLYFKNTKNASVKKPFLFHQSTRPTTPEKSPLALGGRDDATCGRSINMHEEKGKDTLYIQTWLHHTPHLVL